MHLAAAVKRIHKDCVSPDFAWPLQNLVVFLYYLLSSVAKRPQQTCANTHSNPKQIQTNKNLLSVNLQSQTTRKSHNQSEEKTQTRSFNTDVHLRNICNEKLRQN
jgi:hypothetical protein